MPRQKLDRIEKLTRGIDERHLRRGGSLRKRINAEFLFGVVHRIICRSVLLKTAPDHPVAIGVGRYNMVTFGHFAFVARGKNQELTTLAFIRTEISEIANIAEPVIIDEPQHVWRRFDDVWDDAPVYGELVFQWDDLSETESTTHITER